jgi:hypothetical protein
MKITLLVACAAACFAAGAVLADDKVDESKPIELTAVQMDKITAGDLILPNEKVIFAEFLKPNGSAAHPGLFFNPKFGPWQAHINSPVIGCSLDPNC